ncbi:MAG: MFS transporter [Chloroflexota bacterium]
MQKTFSRDRFTWLAYLFLAFYGYYINIIGPVTPFLKDELGLSYTVGSLHYTLFALGILLVGLGGDWAVARLGRWRALWVGAAGLSAGTLLLVGARAPVLTIGATFLMGIIGSLILVIVPTELSDRHGEMRAVALSEANVIASLVAASAPLLVGFFARTLAGWRVALVLVAFTPFWMYLFFRGAKPSDANRAAGRLLHPGVHLPRLYWVYWLCIVLAVAAEFCMISWSADYLETTLHVPQADAAQAVSIFFVAMIVGRIAASRLSQRVTTHHLIAASVLLAIAGFFLYWWAVSIPATLAGLFLTGFGIASLYPLILSLAIGSAGSATVQASTRATLASGTAILTLPLVLGRLADLAGIRQAYGVVLLLLIGVLIVILLTGKLSRHRPGCA